MSEYPAILRRLSEELLDVPPSVSGRTWQQHAQWYREQRDFARRVARIALETLEFQHARLESDSVVVTSTVLDAIEDGIPSGFSAQDAKEQK